MVEAGGLEGAGSGWSRLDSVLEPGPPAGFALAPPDHYSEIAGGAGGGGGGGESSVGDGGGAWWSRGRVYLDNPDRLPPLPRPGPGPAGAVAAGEDRPP